MEVAQDVTKTAEVNQEDEKTAEEKKAVIMKPAAEAAEEHYQFDWLLRGRRWRARDT